MPCILVFSNDEKCIFRQYFKGISFCNFIDGQLSIICDTPKIDINKFADYLREQNGTKYDEYGMSMEKFLHMVYGRQAANFIRELI